MGSLKTLAIAIIAVFAPAQAMILSSLALVLIDLITGVMAARKQSVPITSGGLRRTISKLFIYELAILLGFLTQTYLTGEHIPVASIISGFIGLTELTSCLENLNIIGGNNLLKVILDKIGFQNDHK
jgi:phage-related holin